MAKIIIHNREITKQQAEEQRLLAASKLSPRQRWKKAFELMRFALMFKEQGEVIKKPQAKGVLLRQKIQD